MPAQYGNMQSVSIYIEKTYVEKAETIAAKRGKKRSAIMADILKEGLTNAA